MSEYILRKVGLLTDETGKSPKISNKNGGGDDIGDVSNSNRSYSNSINYNVSSYKRLKIFSLIVIILLSAVICYDPSLESIYKYFDVFCLNEASLGVSQSFFCEGALSSTTIGSNDVVVTSSRSSYVLLSWIDILTCIVSVFSAVSSGYLCDKYGELNVLMLCTRTIIYGQSLKLFSSVFLYATMNYQSESHSTYEFLNFFSFFSLLISEFVTSYASQALVIAIMVLISKIFSPLHEISSAISISLAIFRVGHMINAHFFSLIEQSYGIIISSFIGLCAVTNALIAIHFLRNLLFDASESASNNSSSSSSGYTTTRLEKSDVNKDLEKKEYIHPADDTSSWLPESSDGSKSSSNNSSSKSSNSSSIKRYQTIEDFEIDSDYGNEEFNTGLIDDKNRSNVNSNQESLLSCCFRRVAQFSFSDLLHSRNNNGHEYELVDSHNTDDDITSSTGNKKSSWSSSTTSSTVNRKYVGVRAIFWYLLACSLCLYAAISPFHVRRSIFERIYITTAPASTSSLSTTTTTTSKDYINDNKNEDNNSAINSNSSISRSSISGGLTNRNPIEKSPIPGYYFTNSFMSMASPSVYHYDPTSGKFIDGDRLDDKSHRKSGSKSNNNNVNNKNNINNNKKDDSNKKDNSGVKDDGDKKEDNSPVGDSDRNSDASFSDEGGGGVSSDYTGDRNGNLDSSPDSNSAENNNDSSNRKDLDDKVESDGDVNPSSQSHSEYDSGYVKRWQMYPLIVSSIFSPVVGALIDLYGGRTIWLCASPIFFSFSHIGLLLRHKLHMNDNSALEHSSMEATVLLALLGIGSSVFTTILWSSIPLLASEYDSDQKKSTIISRNSNSNCCNNNKKFGMMFAIASACLAVSQTIFPAVMSFVYQLNNFDQQHSLIMVEYLLVLISIFGGIVAGYCYYKDENDCDGLLRKSIAICGYISNNEDRKGGEFAHFGSESKRSNSNDRGVDFFGHRESSNSGNKVSSYGSISNEENSSINKSSISIKASKTDRLTLISSSISIDVESAVEVISLYQSDGPYFSSPSSSPSSSYSNAKDKSRVYNSSEQMPLFAVTKNYNITNSSNSNHDENKCSTSGNGGVGSMFDGDGSKYDASRSSLSRSKSDGFISALQDRVELESSVPSSDNNNTDSSNVETEKISEGTKNTSISNSNSNSNISSGYDSPEVTNPSVPMKKSASSGTLSSSSGMLSSVLLSSSSSSSSNNSNSSNSSLVGNNSNKTTTSMDMKKNSVISKAGCTSINLFDNNLFGSPPLPVTLGGKNFLGLLNNSSSNNIIIISSSSSSSSSSSISSRTSTISSSLSNKSISSSSSSSSRSSSLSNVISGEGKLSLTQPELLLPPTKQAPDLTIDSQQADRGQVIENSNKNDCYSEFYATATAAPISSLLSKLNRYSLSSFSSSQLNSPTYLSASANSNLHSALGSNNNNSNSYSNNCTSPNSGGINGLASITYSSRSTSSNSNSNKSSFEVNSRSSSNNSRRRSSSCSDLLPSPNVSAHLITSNTKVVIAKGPSIKSNRSSTSPINSNNSNSSNSSSDNSNSYYNNNNSTGASNNPSNDDAESEEADVSYSYTEAGFDLRRLAVNQYIHIEMERKRDEERLKRKLKRANSMAYSGNNSSSITSSVSAGSSDNSSSGGSNLLKDSKPSYSLFRRNSFF